MLAKLAGLFVIVPTTLVLTISFFVLIVLRKVEKGVLKAFGYVVVNLLWVSALLIFLGGVYTLISGSCPGQKMMMQKHGMMSQGMMDKQMMEKKIMSKHMIDKRMMDKQMMDKDKVPETKR